MPVRGRRFHRGKGLRMRKGVRVLFALGLALCMVLGISSGYAAYGDSGNPVTFSIVTPTNLGALERNAYLTVSINPTSASISDLTLAGYLAELSYAPDKLTLISSDSDLIAGATFFTEANLEWAIAQGTPLYTAELVTGADVNVVKLMYLNYDTGVTDLSTETDFLNLNFQVKDDGATGTDLTTLNASITNLCRMDNGTPTDSSAAPIASAGVAIDGPEYVLGDANGDGIVKVQDILIIRNHILGIITLTGGNLEAVDVNRDGLVKVQDILIIRNYLLGIIPTLG